MHNTFSVLKKLKTSKPYVLLIISALAVVLFQYFLGINYSPDSNWYLLLSDLMGNSNDFDRLAVLAPLYYWSLGILKFFGFSTIGSILFYWWISYSAILAILFSATKNIFLSVIGLIAILSNPANLALYRQVWTEMGYSAILMVSVYSFYKLATQKEKSNEYELLFLISISLLPIQRYIGAYISIYLGLVYLFLNIKYILERFRNLIMAALPLIFVVSWNILLTGHISGFRKTGIFTLMENYELAKKVILDFFYPEWVILFIGILIIAIVSFKKRKLNPLIFLLLVPTIQLISQIASSTIYKFDIIGPRFFIVLAPTIVLLVVLWVQEIFKNKINYIFASFIILMLLIGLNIVYGNWNRYPFVDKYPLYDKGYTGSYTSVKKFLSQIKDTSTVGILVGGKKYLSARFILDPKIIPYTHCQQYKTVGDFRSNEILYVPICRNQTGLVYRALEYWGQHKMHYILISKYRLHKNWKHKFKNYNSIDLGSFWGLTKKP